MTDFERRLVALTPATVDRDAVLFAAGRASAPTARWWQRACGLLVVGQVVTLGLWLGERRGSTPPAVVPAIPFEQPQTVPPEPSSYLVLLRTWDTERPTTTPDGGDEPHRSPPLTAGSHDFH